MHFASPWEAVLSMLKGMVILSTARKVKNAYMADATPIAVP